MIRYVHIGDQINEGADEFAFFDTVTLKFIVFSDEQVFDSVEDFLLCASGYEDYERCLFLIPPEKEVTSELTLP